MGSSENGRWASQFKKFSRFKTAIRSSVPHGLKPVLIFNNLMLMNLPKMPFSKVMQLLLLASIKFIYNIYLKHLTLYDHYYNLEK